MTSANRPVDSAMDAERPEKKTVRALWFAKVEAHNARLKAAKSDDRLYLTLCGAGGRDIQMLIDKGIVDLTEAGSLTAESAARIAAIENNPTAVIELLQSYPGLKVHRSSFENLLHGQKATRFPSGDNESLCRSAVVNLDLNNCLEAVENNGGIVFPLIDQLDKLATIHTTESKLEWTLLLTLHGELNWSDPVWTYVIEFLLENMGTVQEFNDAVNALWGAGSVAALTGQNVAALKAAKPIHQRLVLSLLPKLIADKVRNQRWAIHVDWCFAYGGTNQSAPMVTWSIDFKHADVGATPTAMYRQNVARILTNVLHIDDKGKPQPFAQ